MNTDLSVVIIVKNAEETMRECLESVTFADEVILVDSGSTDKTKEIAAEFPNVKLSHQDWLGFGKQKQYAVSLASHNWVLCLDADEMVSDNLREEIIQTLQNPSHHVYCFLRRNLFMGRWLRYGENLKDNVTRLFHKDHAKWSDHSVHEHVQTDEAIFKLKGHLMHKSAVSLEDYMRKGNHYTSIQASEIAFKKSLIFKIIFNPMMRFLKFYIIRLGFLDGLAGFVHILTGCFHCMIRYCKVIDNHYKKSA